MIVAWTGHRPDLFQDAQSARAVVAAAARELVAAGRVERFLVGGQRGVDTWAAQAALDNGMPFTLILPLSVAEFTHGWMPQDRQQLEQHMQQADRVRVVGVSPPEAAFTERNRLLAASADLLVAVWTGRAGGGTAETVAFARQLGTRVREIRLAASDAATSIVGRGN